LRQDDPETILKTAGLGKQISSFSGGQWLSAGSGEALPSEDPSTAAVIAEVFTATSQDTDRAVQNSDHAYRRVWSRTTPAERGAFLATLSQQLKAECDTFARLESLDTGKPVSQARGDVLLAARYFEFYADAVDKLGTETTWAARADLAYTVREPFGVVAQIIPWNSPISQLARGVAAALASGNTVVLKPSELAPLSSLAFGQFSARAGLPAGVLNVLAGPGSTGQALARHPLVKQITFTGSVESGRAVLEASAVNIVPVTLELGGKSPGLVFPDADLDAAARAAVGAMRRNSGQSCSALTRILVHEQVHDQLLDRILDATRKLTFGPGLGDPDLGPLISAKQRARVERLVDSARQEGARIAHGGGRPSGDEFSRGYFVEPTVLTGIANTATAARTEIFGPVQSLIVFSDEDEAVAMANDSDYGLSSAVFTADFARAHRVANQLEAGQVHINEYPMDSAETPFGGYKSSGIGREKGLLALHSYTQVKTILARIPAAQPENS
jgi:aldehyde dehydrogenase (NAD+)